MTTATKSVVAQPPLQVHPSAQPHITDRVQSILNELHILLINEAQRDSVEVTRIEVSAFRDPEDDTVELFLTQWVRLSPVHALEYWDRIGVTVQNWSHQLSSELREIILERIAIEVQWDESTLSVP